jgi:hypothetical protein
MKLNSLRELVKEELKRALYENEGNPSFLGDLELGTKYKVYYSARDNQGEKDLGDTTISITQDDINKYGGNKSIKNYLTALFNTDTEGNPVNAGYTINGIRKIEKLANSLNELKKEINEIIDDILEETQLNEITAGDIEVDEVFTLNGSMGPFKSGERVRVTDKRIFGQQIHIYLSNDQGVADDFIIDSEDEL